MDRHNIVLGFLSSADLGIVQDWVAAAPKRFIASPFIEKPGELTPQMLRKEYAAGRLAGMGEIGSQLVGVAPNDPALAPYFALAEEFDVPVLIHTEGIGPPVPGFARPRAVRSSARGCWFDIGTLECSSRTAGTRFSTR
jgi:predicted TIM-barrel fold metal-dependent hydrolase